MTNDIEEARAKRNGEHVYEMSLDFMVDDDPSVDVRSFCLGVEFWQCCSLVRNGWRGIRPVHLANKERLLSALSKFPDIKHVTIASSDNDDTWADLAVV